MAKIMPGLVWKNLSLEESEYVENIFLEIFKEVVYDNPSEKIKLIAGWTCTRSGKPCSAQNLPLSTHYKPLKQGGNHGKTS